MIFRNSRTLVRKGAFAITGYCSSVTEPRARTITFSRTLAQLRWGRSRQGWCLAELKCFRKCSAT